MARKWISRLAVAGMLCAHEAAAQNSRQVIELFGAIMQTAIEQALLAEWKKLPASQLQCIDEALRQQGQMLQSVIQQGMSPSHPALAYAQAQCGHQTTASIPEPAPQNTSPYVVDGLPLGNRVAFGSAVYQQYQCGLSEQFPDFTRCQRKLSETGPRGKFESSNSILHTADGTTVYVNRHIAPAFFAAGDVDNEVERLSQKIGERPRILRLPKRSDVATGTIAIWGPLTFSPLDAESVTVLASGGSVRKGIMVDHLSDFTRSAKLGLPIYAVTGGPGFVWSASADRKGRGHLRFFAIDGMALAEAASRLAALEQQKRDDEKRADEAKRREEMRRQAEEQARQEAARQERERKRLEEEQKRQEEARRNEEERQRREREARWRLAALRLSEDRFASLIRKCDDGYVRLLERDARTIAERTELRERARFECRCTMASLAFHDTGVVNPGSVERKLAETFETGMLKTDVKEYITAAQEQCKANVSSEILNNWKAQVRAVVGQ
jgi:flagellar biosynthesis GTPase FlhF